MLYTYCKVGVKLPTPICVSTLPPDEDANVIGGLRNSLNPILRWNPKRVAVDRLLQFVRMNHADVHFIGERRSKDVGVTDRKCVCREAVISSSGFTNSQPWKTRGNGIGNKASIEYAKQDVVCIEVLIDADVVAIGVLRLLRSPRKVVVEVRGRYVLRRKDPEQFDRVRVNPACRQHVHIGRQTGEIRNSCHAGVSAVVVKGVTDENRSCAVVDESRDRIERTGGHLTRRSWIQDSSARKHTAKSIRAGPCVHLEFIL